jgi:hypothetical protein
VRQTPPIVSGDVVAPEISLNQLDAIGQGA